MLVKAKLLLLPNLRVYFSPHVGRNVLFCLY